MLLHRRTACAIALAILTAASPAGAQTFTRVTDPTNPINGDFLQSCGAAWIDLVGDGYLDLFVANGNLTSQNNRLYRNDRAGGFVRVVTGAIVSDGGPSIGVTAGDFDGDGLVDLFVPNRNNFGNFLYRGLGDTLFARVSTAPFTTDFANSNSASWVDVDGDGDLDLSVVNFQGNDFLYLNGGGPGFAFTRVDTTAITPGAEFSIPGAWADENGDGRPDLFVGNAGAQNDYLYLNHGGLFFTRTVVADGLSTLGASWGDCDDDGALDLVTTHYSGQHFTLYRNGGAPDFALTPVASAISTDAGNWVGSAFGDYDNDGALDLFLARDGATGELFHNDGPPGYGFTRVASGPIATDVTNAFAAVWGDYDRDGQLDLFVCDHTGAGNRLYHNGGTANHWLTVRVHGTSSNRSGIGARIRLYAAIGGAPRLQLREVTSQTGYNSANLDEHFGLGDAALADSIVVDWPSGAHDVWRSVAPDRFLELTEGSETVAVDEPAGGGASIRLESPRPNPGHGAERLAFTLPTAGHVRLEIFDVRGRRVATSLDAWCAAGRHDVGLDLPADLPAGLYLCRLAAAGESHSVRLARLR